MRIVLLALTLAIAAAPAKAFRTSAGQTVVPGPGETFTVAHSGKAGAPVFWCSAADYAHRALGAARTDRLWRLDPPPRARGQGIRFATTPPATPTRTGLILLGRDDGSLSVGHGLAFCLAARSED